MITLTPQPIGPPPTKKLTLELPLPVWEQLEKVATGLTREDNKPSDVTHIANQILAGFLMDPSVKKRTRRPRKQSQIATAP